ncbi:hypothetical protein [Oceanicella sp. SM1341]|nr:hypothetical protein [Oceanicella sp. SM1341]
MNKLLDYLKELVGALLPEPQPQPQPIPVRVNDGRRRPGRR